MPTLGADGLPNLRNLSREWEPLSSDCNENVAKLDDDRADSRRYHRPKQPPCHKVAQIAGATRLVLKRDEYADGCNRWIFMETVQRSNAAVWWSELRYSQRREIPWTYWARNEQVFSYLILLHANHQALRRSTVWGPWRFPRAKRLRNLSYVYEPF